MKNKKIPLRSCIISREKLPKKELLRIVRTPEGNIIIDETGRANGRGAYLKKDINIINKARLNKQLENHLECNIPDSIYDEIVSIINNS